MAPFSSVMAALKSGEAGRARVVDQSDGNTQVAKAGSRLHHCIRVRLLFTERDDVTHTVTITTVWASHCEVKKSADPCGSTSHLKKRLRAMLNITQCYSLLAVGQPHD